MIGGSRGAGKKFASGKKGLPRGQRDKFTLH